MNELDRKDMNSKIATGSGVAAAILGILCGLGKMVGKAAGDSTNKAMAEAEWNRVNGKSGLWKMMHSSEVQSAKDNLKKYGG